MYLVQHKPIQGNSSGYTLYIILSHGGKHVCIEYNIIIYNIIYLYIILFSLSKVLEMLLKNIDYDYDVISLEKMFKNREK